MNAIEHVAIAGDPHDGGAWAAAVTDWRFGLTPP